MTELIKKESTIVPADMAEKIIKLTELKNNVTAQLDELKEQLLSFTQANDVYTLKTGSYTISRGKRQTVTVLDHQAAFEKMEELGLGPTTAITLSPESLETAKNYVKKGNKLNGVSHQETEYITVKIAKEK